VSAVLGLLVWGGVAWTPAASAATSHCLVINATSGARYTSLQAAQNAAGAGATLWLRGTCTGTTKITKNLTVTGQHRRGFTAPTLNGGGQGSVLAIRSGVALTVNTLAVTGGNAVSGGGIVVNTGSSLTLNNVTVSGNIAADAGGIFVSNGTVTLNGSATITGNTAAPADGGGIFNLCGTLHGAVAGAGGNVFNNKPDNIMSVCA